MINEPYRERIWSRTRCTRTPSEPTARVSQILRGAYHLLDPDDDVRLSYEKFLSTYGTDAERTKHASLLRRF